MMYDEMKSMYPEKQFGEITVKPDYGKPRTCQERWNHEKEANDPPECGIKEWGWEAHAHENNVDFIGLQFELPHSCDEWVIGNVGSAEAFHEHLTEAIAYAKTLPLPK